MAESNVAVDGGLGLQPATPANVPNPAPVLPPLDTLTTPATPARVSVNPPASPAKVPSLTPVLPSLDTLDNSAQVSVSSSASTEQSSSLPFGEPWMLAVIIGVVVLAVVSWTWRKKSKK